MHLNSCYCYTYVAFVMPLNCALSTLRCLCLMIIIKSVCNVSFKVKFMLFLIKKIQVLPTEYHKNCFKGHPKRKFFSQNCKWNVFNTVSRVCVRIFSCFKSQVIKEIWCQSCRISVACQKLWRHQRDELPLSTHSAKLNNSN